MGSVVCMANRLLSVGIPKLVCTAEADINLSSRCHQTEVVGQQKQVAIQSDSN